MNRGSGFTYGYEATMCWKLCHVVCAFLCKFMICPVLNANFTLEVRLYAARCFCPLPCATLALRG